MQGRPVTVSLGVAAAQRGERWSFARLFDAADRALYDATRDGRDRVGGAAQRELIAA